MNNEYSKFITPTVNKAQTKFMYNKIRELAKKILKNPSEEIIEAITKMLIETGLDPSRDEIKEILQDYADCINQIGQRDLNNARYNRVLEKN